MCQALSHAATLRRQGRTAARPRAPCAAQDRTLARGLRRAHCAVTDRCPRLTARRARPAVRASMHRWEVWLVRRATLDTTPRAARRRARSVPLTHTAPVPAPHRRRLARRVRRLTAVSAALPPATSCPLPPPPRQIPHQHHLRNEHPRPRFHPIMQLRKRYWWFYKPHTPSTA
jgi:hypothetical protein